MHQVRRVSMEVNADDCHTLYAGQPSCTLVLARMQQLGFFIAGDAGKDFPCAPRFKRRLGSKRSAFGCETELLFVSKDVSSTPDVFWQFHKPGLQGCVGLYNKSQRSALLASPPAGKAVMDRVKESGGHLRLGELRFHGTGRADWIGGALHSYGMDYWCPETLFS